MTTTASKTQPDARTALAQRRENGGVAENSLANEIRKMEKEFQVAMPRGAEATQLIRDALTALRMTRNLGKCDTPSVLGSLMTCAQLGLRPGVLGHAWLLPFWASKHHQDEKGKWIGGYKAQLVIGYQGLIELAHRSGRIASLIARTVHENDEFEVDYGVADTLVHKPNLFADRGAPIAYYAVAKFQGGGYAFYVMSHRDMEQYRDRHATAKTREGKVFGPWVDHFEGMAHKTCVRQLAKFMPKSAELAAALAADEGIRVDLTPTTGPEEATERPEYDVDGDFVENSPTEVSQAEAPVAAEPNGTSK
ncbi:recombination protein RecT [Plantactinospora sp. WMMB782]|uniref:recombination protein RecT n=1 Tax=Plantactinospora sp. WMMB782 TaxID=3404121 RepID=UPI003B95DEB5